MKSPKPPITCHLLSAPQDKLMGDHILWSFHYATTTHPILLSYAPTSSELKNVLDAIAREKAATEEDFVILADASATPLIITGQLRNGIETALSENPAADFFSLHTGHGLHNGETTLFEPAALHDISTPVPQGLPPIAIPVSNLETVCRALPDSDLPAAVALSLAVRDGLLCAMQSLRPCFYQWLESDPELLQQTKSTRPGLRLAVCMPSYKRPEDLQRQLFCILSQTYDNFDVFVAVKGMTRNTFESIVLPYFRNEVEQGKITLRFFPNKNQLSNFIDVVRDLDMTGYDLIVKFDDDELYSPDYLSHINAIHSLLPPDFSSYMHGSLPVINRFDGFPVMGRFDYHTCGSSLVLGKSAMAKLMQCEETPDLVSDLVPTVRWEYKPALFGFCEDQLMRMIMQEHGVVNRGRYLQTLRDENHIIIQRGNSSVTRGNLVTNEFYKNNRGFADHENNREYLLELSHPQWKGALLCWKNRVKLFPANSEGDLLLHTDHKIIVKWDKWGEEHFVANQDGTYHFIEQP